ncbi:hypothetical protein BX661DRAFT_51531 [Kickxella alabastrina]|uniref:uncharacterized protein n=1 Tax=Kickxella alabastrina TaxID=61397 RepID=UPI0022208C0A|nr:uncharacterized protein BX661DRAFT_51531 [Kickxella alabastrina]KAI7834332.1 hypothetical protein BX661DRAFT_51531 [Kickxella alabastrina]KAJ1946108.1 hypothetical protein GGF37_001354 [Kickxella alabastrina]
MATPDSLSPSSVKALGQILLLESFLDDALRHALGMLKLHICLGRLHGRESEHGGDAQSVTGADNLRRALADIYPKVKSEFGIIDKLCARTGGSEPSEGLRIRSRVHELVCVCFPDILEGSVAEETRISASSGTSASRSGAIAQQPNAGHLWTLVRPCQSPSVVLHMFLRLSADVAQVQRNSYNTTEPLLVGHIWYDLLADILAQLALASLVFGDITFAQVLTALEVVSPGSSDRAALYPTMWGSENAADIVTFDAKWRRIRAMVESLLSTRANASTVLELLDMSPSHNFLNNLIKYISAVLDHLRPPPLGIYAKIKQTGRIPSAFFETPDQMADLPTHLQPTLRCEDDCSDTESIQFSLRPATVGPLDSSDDDYQSSPLGHISLAHAYSGIPLPMPMSMVRDCSKLTLNPKVRPRRSMGDMMRVYTNLEDQQDISAPSPAHQTTPSISHGMLDVDDTNDIDMSPTVCSLARRRMSLVVRADIPSCTAQCEQYPPFLNPPLQLAITSAGMHPIDELSTPSTVAQPPPTESGMTTPKLQTSEQAKCERSKYVPDRPHGDVEGGGRPHRRRSFCFAAKTPGAATVRPDDARRTKRLWVESELASDNGVHGAQAINPAHVKHAGYAGMAEYPPLLGTPDRGKSASAEDANMTQITPEHQIGTNADIRALTASRYIAHKDQGDTEGGGRRHRKRQRRARDSFLPIFP